MEESRHLHLEGYPGADQEHAGEIHIPSGLGLAHELDKAATHRGVSGSQACYPHDLVLNMW